jgi:hypothetical protein
MRGGKSGGFKDAMRPQVQRWHDESEGAAMGTGRRRANKGKSGSYRKKHKSVKHRGAKMPRLDRGR